MAVMVAVSSLILGIDSRVFVGGGSILLLLLLLLLPVLVLLLLGGGGGGGCCYCCGCRVSMILCVWSTACNYC